MSDSLVPNKAGEDITRRSVQIIRSRLGPFSGSEEELALVIRVAHTTGDVEFGKSLRFSTGAVLAGAEAIKAGASIITDASMVASGIRSKRLVRFGCRLRCLLDDEGTSELAREEGITRSQAAMRRALPLLDGAVVAIGNAPTALFELLDLIRYKAASPALVIGVPVGFVGALESKQELWALESAVPKITNLSERGGSPVAAAAVNALIAMAEGVPW